METKKAVMHSSILIGNGINRSFAKNGDSLEKLLNQLMPDTISDEQKAGIPFPLKIVMGTENNVDKKMQDWSEKLWGEITDLEQMEFYNRILRLPVQDLFTTNYGFELEEASRGMMQYPITKSMVLKITDHTEYNGLSRNEGSIFLHTYQKCRVDDREKRIWHIHGHAKNPSSMIIGHYYYGKLLHRYQTYLSAIGRRYQKEQDQTVKDTTIESWLDAFILNDVYVLGFGFDFAEMDLWWLLERKNREKAAHGKVYFYEPQTSDNDVKHRLLSIYGAEVRTLGYRIEKDDSDVGKKYKEFYYRVMEDIEKRLCESDDF